MGDYRFDLQITHLWSVQSKKQGDIAYLGTIAKKLMTISRLCDNAQHVSESAKTRHEMKTYRKFAVLLLIMAMALGGTGVRAQTAPQLPADRTVIITFIVPVDSNSANMLIRTIAQQSDAGVKNITLVLASPGGDTAAAFAAYNILKTLPIELTTFNVGNIDSAAMLLYCAGKHRYSLPGPGVRFLIHGNSMTLGVGVPMDANFMEAQTAQLKNLNEMVIDALSVVAPKKRGEIEKAVQSQVILSPEEAKDWGIVQQVKDSYMTPGAMLLAVNQPSPPQTDPIQYKSLEPVLGSKTITH
jgi:ATP-dependent protease ClpP protease subunit